MKRELSKIFALAVMALAFGATAAVTDYEWKFDESARSSLIVEPAVGSKTVVEPWACPSWVEAYCEGGIFSPGLILLVK